MSSKTQEALGLVLTELKEQRSMLEKVLTKYDERHYETVSTLQLHKKRIDTCETAVTALQNA